MVAAVISLTTVLTTVSAFATVLAAVAAVIALRFARATVKESQQARADNQLAHMEEMSEAARQTLAAAQQYQAEATERARAEAAALVDRRLEQLERISDLLLLIVDVARDETRAPPERLGPGITGTRLPAILMRLENAVSVLDSLGGPQPAKAAELAERGYGAGSQPIQWVGDGIEALREVRSLVSSVPLRRDRSGEASPSDTIAALLAQPGGAPQ
jgi:hypothetical protein